MDYVTADACQTKYHELLGAINKLSDRLYKDNGKKSIQTRLNSLDQLLKIFIWVASIAGATLIIDVIHKLISRGS